MNDVFVAHLHPGNVTATTTVSLDQAYGYDFTEGGNRLLYPVARNQSGVDLAKGRDEIVDAFLDATEASWLMMIDADMGFEQTAIHRLLEVAHARKRPIVAGLCFAMKRAMVTAEHGWRVNVFPTVYDFVDTGGDESNAAGFRTRWDYEREALIEVDGTGAAFMLIHRSVCRTIKGKYGSCYGPMTHHRTGRVFGEDLSFCVKAAGCDFPIHVDTSVKTCHVKTLCLDEWTFDEWPHIRKDGEWGHWKEDID